MTRLLPLTPVCSSDVLTKSEKAPGAIPVPSFTETHNLTMAPKKRKRTVQTAASAPTKQIRVKCPACETISVCITQKEVPSFFVNSHLDLECRELTKSGALSRLPAPSPAAGKNSGYDAPSINQLQGRSIRIEESIRQSSLEDECSLAATLSDFNEAKDPFGEDEIDEDVEDGDNGFRDGGFASDIPPEMFRKHSVGFKDDELENTGRDGECALPSSSSQSAHQRVIRPLALQGKPWKLATVSDCFPPLPPPKVMAPKGLQVVEDFITLEEEKHLLHCLDTDISNPWKLNTVNGIHQGKAYGNHIFGDYNRKVVSQANSPMPDFVLPYVKRMRDTVPALKEFFPNEMNSIDYRKGNGHYLKAHMDDRQLSGKILVNLSLAGGCFMTYARELGLKEAFRVKLAPRSLQILTGESRYSYTHGIQRNDILDPRRVSMTFRQSVETSQNVRPSRLH
ncbi:unnamed protein product [Calypogeia fissa]